MESNKVAICIATRDLTFPIQHPGWSLKWKPHRLWAALELSCGSIGATRKLLILPSPEAVSTQRVRRISLLRKIKRVVGVWPGVSCAIPGVSTTCQRIIVLSGCGQLVGMSLAC